MYPQSHKVTLSDISAGDPILRYGYVIGHALRDIQKGSWVREDMLDLPEPPPLDHLPLATATPAAQPSLEGYTFEGYLNRDGSTATRNILGLATTVQCVAPTVDYAVKRIQAEILPRFPNVDDVTAITHSYGCGVAIDAPGAAIPIHTLKHISMHANLAARPLIVSLGCEKLQPARLFSSDFPVLQDDSVLRLQDHRGFAATVSAIMEAAEKASCRTEHPAAPNTSRQRTGGGAAMRRQRRLFRSNLQPCPWALPRTCWFAPAPPSCSQR